MVEFINVPNTQERQENIIDTLISSQKMKGFIVVEKDTVFSRIKDSQWFIQQYQDNTLLMTAKGYPDFSSKQFLDLLLKRIGREGLNIPCIYIGDADPHGSDIYFQYSIGTSLQSTFYTSIWQPQSTDP